MQVEKLVMVLRALVWQIFSHFFRGPSEHSCMEHVLLIYAHHNKSYSESKQNTTLPLLFAAHGAALFWCAPLIFA